MTTPEILKALKAKYSRVMVYKTDANMWIAAAYNMQADYCGVEEIGRDEAIRLCAERAGADRAGGEKPIAPRTP